MTKISNQLITFIAIMIVFSFVLTGCEKPQPKQEVVQPPPQPAQQPAPLPPQSPQPPSAGGTPPAQLGKGSTDPVAQKEIPVEAKLNMQQGMNYMRGKDWDNAIKEFTIAIQKHPAYDVAYSNRAVAYMQQKKFNKAMDDLKEAEKINPRNSSVHYNFVSLYSLQNQLDRALDSLDRCLELGFNNYDALRADTDLNNVRKHPEFRKILEKHKVFLK